MIKAAMDRILELAKPNLETRNGRQYVDKKLYPVEEPVPDLLIVHTLTGMLDYLACQYAGDLRDEEIFLHVLSREKVKLLSGIFGPFCQRKEFAVAVLPDNRGYPFGQWLDVETFIIQLQAQFVNDLTVENLLAMVSTIKDEAVKTSADDGITQTVTARAGAALITEVKVPNPVTLRPYRTFLEVEQPASSFVFRLRSGRDKPELSLHEADGGQWRLEAIQNIKKYLEKKQQDFGPSIPDIPVIA